MNLDVVIGQIKALASVFSGNVAGAAAYAHGIDEQVWLPTPAAYVVPLDEDANPNDDLNALWQACTERFQVIVHFDNSADRRGQAITARYELVKLALFAAVLNWRPDSSVDNPGIVDPADPASNRAAKGLYFGGGALVDFDRARLFYQWTFCLDTAISDADGWQPPGDPLTEINVSVPSDHTGSTIVVSADVPLAQT